MGLVDVVILTFVVLLFGVVIMIAPLRAFVRDGPTHSKVLERAAEQFSNLSHRDDENRLSYDGKSAHIVLERVDISQQPDLRGLHNQLVLHRIFRNESGEYFVFISGEPPFVQHLTPERAMNALRVNPKAFEREFGQAVSRST